MSKRSNPYVDDFVPQSKTHIGLKQFNNNEDRMQKVYEKTLQLLFKGAKKTLDLEEAIKPTDTVHLAKKDCMKQLIINKDGTLLNSEFVETREQCPIPGCRCCIYSEAETCCTYCETALCSACSRLCGRCCLPFCAKCSLIGSEGTEICVSCYG